jgi:predicted transcriptional regulator
MPPKTRRTKTLTVRLTQETYNAAEKVAHVTCRTLSSMVEYAVQRYIEKNFPEAYNPKSKVTIMLDDA